MRKRTKEIKIRMTPDEHAHFLERVPEDMALAEWVRTVCLNGKPPRRKKVRKADSELLIAIARIGNNMNQIAREVNTSRDSLNVAKTLLELSIIREQLDTLVEAHTNDS